MIPPMPPFAGEEERKEFEEELKYRAQEAINAMREAMMDVATNIGMYAPFEYFLQSASIIFEPNLIAATDGNRFYVGIPFTILSREEKRFVVIHELWHIIAGDSFRIGNLDHNIWNIAADIINNDYILKQGLEGVKMPEGALHDTKYQNMTREALYDLIIEMCKQYGYFELNGKRIPCEQLRRKKNGEGDPLSGDVKPNPNTADKEETDRRLKESEKRYTEKMHGQGSWLRDWINMPYTAKLPWNAIIQQYLQRIAATDYTWANPKQLYGITGEPLYLPKLRQKTVKIAVAIDTSGSINALEANMFVKELQKLISAIFVAGSVSGVLMLITDSLYAAIKIPPMPTIDQIKKKITETGGTSFIPAFQYIHDVMHDDIDLLIYFTDGFGTYPDLKPKYPVIWVVTTKIDDLKKAKYYPPFGKVIEL